MPQPRKNQICLAQTPYYHCVSRCVRRAFLCGFDSVTGKSYEHRRAWVEKKLLFLAQVFAIDVCAYAIMHNHTHAVLHVNLSQAKAWSDREVLSRWHRIFRGTPLTQKYMNNELLTQEESRSLKESISMFRTRLTCISWFMRVLNEAIARRANREDECTGRFWEGRFKCQALLDESALLACMAYVDLNPIRAQIEKSIETSSFTSISKRLKTQATTNQINGLMCFSEAKSKKNKSKLPFTLSDYIELLKITEQTYCRSSKQIHRETLPLLQTLQIKKKNWLKLNMMFETLFKGPVGSYKRVKAFNKYRGKANRALKIHQSIFA